MQNAEFVVDVISLKKYMLDMGIDTIAELSKKSGVNRNTLSDVLNQKTKPSADVMYKLVICLGIPSAKAGEIFFNTNLRIA